MTRLVSTIISLTTKETTAATITLTITTTAVTLRAGNTGWEWEAMAPLLFCVAKRKKGNKGKKKEFQSRNY